MNKLVIVGNGFDLAHGLPTSYRNFIDDFWTNFVLNPKTTTTEKIFAFGVENLNFDFADAEHPPQNYSEFIRYLPKFCQRKNYILESGSLTIKNRSVHLLSIKNEFFYLISSISERYWLDIENLYYKILKDLVKNHSSSFYRGDINKLNNEFEDVKTLLNEYLKINIVNKFNFKSKPENEEMILSLFRLRFRNLSNEPEHSVFFEFPSEDHGDFIEFDENIKMGHVGKLYTLFLDFNYTPTVSHYVSAINSVSLDLYGEASLIKIHGEVDSKSNPINFGFGDEMDDDYKVLEKANENKYFKNIKSFQYLHNSEYRKLLNWIETNKFQVYIFGHSCGLSDRTLLNTIFENHNCRSIKIFYHSNGNSDNYTELTHNISRHFNQKKVMRSKIVDKTNCIPLPQTVRFNTK